MPNSREDEDDSNTEKSSIGIVIGRLRMKEVIVVAVILAVIGGSLAIRVCAQTPASQQKLPQEKMNPADAGRKLREMMLTTPSASIGAVPTDDFPRVYGVLMDWPIGGDTATVFSASDGSASLYTTSTFGIIGGEGHQLVREAAIRFVRSVDRFYDAATPTKEYPYPTSDQVRFYLLTYQGVRVIDADLASITNHTSRYTELFALGQAVLAELRLITEKAQ